TPMADAIGAHYNVEVRNVFTGFKYIGAIATALEESGELDRYLMGFEESYGYCVGAHVRDKDAVVATLFVCEMAAFYKKQGGSLLGRLEALYGQYGFYAIRQKSFTFEGVEGMQIMADIMAGLRKQPPTVLNGETVTAVTDYEAQTRTETATGKVSATGKPPTCWPTSWPTAAAWWCVRPAPSPSSSCI
ncbi:MAG: hypothetical protein IJC25_04815, partial [Clostridia bacterium]|nr:hypothetical protein [Clostridia bacterium]